MATALVCVCFLAGHLPVLSPTPASIDAVNFVLGVRQFDLADHRPHPPGYPVYIALGKVSRWVWTQVDPHPSDPLKAETRSLAFWAVVFGGLSAWPLLLIFRGLGASDLTALGAVVLTLASPLFWMTALRPLSDVPGLVVGLVAQALLLSGFGESPGADEEVRRRRRTALTCGAFTAGLAIGMRSQNLWLTLPLALVVLVRSPQRGRSLWLRMTAAGGIGVLAWAIPLLLATGGFPSYTRAFLIQAAQDWTGARIVATAMTWEQFTTALTRTFVFPWAADLLASVVLLCAAVALVATVVRPRRSLALILTLYGPYLAFHLIFQESEHTRYGLPLVPPVAYLAVRGLEMMSGRFMPLAVAGAAVASLVTIVPATLVYAERGHPAFKVIDDIATRQADLADDQPRPVLSMHHAASRLLRGADWRLKTLLSPPEREWLEKVSYWRYDGDAPIWLIADSRRTDVALFDRASRRLVHRYEWPFQLRYIFNGVWPKSVSWYEITPPGWMADEGWALTPEIAGLTYVNQTGPERRPIHAFIRRRDEGAVVLAGGRFLSADPSQIARIKVEIDDRPVGSWDVEPGPFLKLMPLEPGQLAGADRYAILRLSAEVRDPNGRIEMDQFDAQSAGTPVYGLDGDGWSPMVQDTAIGETWRRIGASADIRVSPIADTLEFRLRVDQPPGRYASVRAGDIVLSVTPPRETVDLNVLIPPDVLARAGNVLTLETRGVPRDGLRVREVAMRVIPVDTVTSDRSR